ncbi:hypothetical protein GZL_00332 [Streptomyces sp. 769]|nr:hypothetical protein GZL_00332 [Streptomyces sp. 769]
MGRGAAGPGLGPLIVNPVRRHPAVIASSIATVAGMPPGRTMLTYGAGARPSG